MNFRSVIALATVLICFPMLIDMVQGQVYEIWVKGADSSNVVGAKVYVEYGGQRPYLVGNTNAEGDVRTPSDVESGLHKVTVQMGKKCTFSNDYEFVPGRTVEVILPCYPTTTNKLKVISGWLVGDLNEDGSVLEIEVRRLKELDIVSGSIYQDARRNYQGTGPRYRDWIVGDLNLDNRVSTREVNTMKQLWEENLVNLPRCVDSVNNWENTGKQP